VLPAAVRRSYRCTADRMRQARRAPAGTPADVALHEARKAAKRARYAGEAAAADTENPSSAGIIEFWHGTGDRRLPGASGMVSRGVGMSVIVAMQKPSGIGTGLAGTAFTAMRDNMAVVRF